MNTEATAYLQNQYPSKTAAMKGVESAINWGGLDLQESLLIEQAKQGNQHAFDSLIRKYRISILRATQRIIMHREDAEDVAQEAILRAFQCLRQFKGISKFSTWLNSIAVNQSLMALRKRRSSRVVSLVCETDECEYLHEPIDLRLDPERSYCREEIEGRIQHAIDRLPQSLRSAFILRYIDDLSTGQTARQLGISVAAVKSRVHRARVALKDRLQSYVQTTPENKIEWESALR